MILCHHIDLAWMRAAYEGRPAEEVFALHEKARREWAELHAPRNEPLDVPPYTDDAFNGKVTP